MTRDNKNYRNKRIGINSINKLQVLDFDYTGSPEEIILEEMKTSRNGLSEKEARSRLRRYGYNEFVSKKKKNLLIQILSRFKNPLIIVLLIIAIFSLFFDQPISALSIFLMAIISILLSFIQEHKAGKEVERLNKIVHTTTTVYRNGKAKEINIRKLVPGDIVDLSAGNMIPADLRIVFCKDLFINEASLTGESFPVEKISIPLIPKDNSISELRNIAFMGSSVVSGTAIGVVLKTGISTHFGEFSKKVTEVVIKTSFDKGIRDYTILMIRAMILMVAFIFAINAFRRGDLIESLLFSLGVAVGLTPEALPMIVTLNLSKGAIAMSKKEVIVKRLNSIQDFGAMNILCMDKTGTLTMDKIVLEKYCDVMGRENEDVLRCGYINSFYQTGLKDLLDQAILKHKRLLVKSFEKVDEMPFDFSRRLMSVVVKDNEKHKIISKGAPEEIFKRCSYYELDGRIIKINNSVLSNLKKEYDKLSSQGFRVLAVAYKDVKENKNIYSKNDEIELILKGYLAFLDPPKPTAKETISALEKLGIEIKVLTGDNDLVAKKICSEVGIDIKGLVTGDLIEEVNDEEFQELIKNTTIFARLLPLQKQKIINALRKNQQVVGFLGDGINDALAMKSADVGISVNNAVDIAKESADIILLRKSLMVLKEGIIEGRKTFGNILKYIKMSSSSNFGNMLSMTGGSLFLPFLPMLPIQIILNNFLYDISQVAVPSDEVDKEYIIKARPWNTSYIKKFMLILGPISSLFDFLTYGVMLFVFNASAPLFHTGWFIESLCTQILVVHIIRTGKIPFIESRPSRFLILTSILIVAAGIFIPFSPLAEYLGFVSLPPLYFIILFLIVGAYLFSVQLVKKLFIKKYGYE